MRAQVIGLLLLGVFSGACKKKPVTPTNGSGSDTQPLGKTWTLAWGITANGTKTDVFLGATDERGAAVSHPLGTFDGTCQPIPPPAAMGSILTVQCKNGPTGIELDVVARRDRVVITKLRIDDGVAPDPMAREPLTEIMAPQGARIEAAP